MFHSTLLEFGGPRTTCYQSAEVKAEGGTLCPPTDYLLRKRQLNVSPPPSRPPQPCKKRIQNRMIVLFFRQNVLPATRRDETFHSPRRSDFFLRTMHGDRALPPPPQTPCSTRRCSTLQRQTRADIYSHDGSGRKHGELAHLRKRVYRHAAH